jgi:hypothetical protein
MATRWLCPATTKACIRWPCRRRALVRFWGKEFPQDSLSFLVGMVQGEDCKERRGPEDATTTPGPHSEPKLSS